MNPLHFPSYSLCYKLTNIGFPKTEKVWNMRDKTIVDYDEYIGGTLCPSVMEMLDAIPKFILNGDDIHNLTMEKEYVYYSGSPAIFAVLGTLPDALAEMVLWLVENNYISFSK